jgi:glycosyltransferase involved in cell wall biosynthesis
VKVVHLVSGDLWAGREAATFELLRALAQRSDVQPGAVVLNDGELARRLDEVEIPVAIEPESGRSFASLARAVRRRVADAALVHAHGYKEDVLAACTGRSWIATQHGRPEPLRAAARARFALYDRLDRAAQRFGARRVVAVSDEIAAWLAPRVGAGRVVRVPNGIRDPLRGCAPPGWRARPLRAGVVGRLFPVKGVELAVEAVAACPGVELDVVGEGPERARLEGVARSLGAGDRVRFVGFDPRPVERMAGWRLLLMPSLHEGSPIAVLEALSVGTPVLAGPLPGVAEILAGCAGFLLGDRCVRTWAAALAARLHDEDAGEAASRAARARFVHSYTSERCAAEMAALYHATRGAAAA